MKQERGTVTAESALVLPLLAAFAMSLVWMVTVMITQVQTVDAARDAARALAQGDARDIVLARAQDTAPEGARIEVSGTHGSVTVSVSTEAVAPGWLLVPLPPLTVGSHSTVEVEADVVIP